MGFRVPISNFSKGAISPELYGRFDVQQWQAALKTCRNFVPLKTGGVTFRPGTRLVGEVYDSTKDARLIPFQFANDQAYAIEFGQGTARFAALGGLVIEEELAISGITRAVNAQVTIAYHGYVAGDDIYFQGITGMTEINGKTGRVLTVIDANSFTVDINTSGYGVFTGATGGIVRTGPPTPAPVAPTVPPPVADEPPPVVLPPWDGFGLTFF